jgi:hypothetical protein
MTWTCRSSSRGGEAGRLPERRCALRLNDVTHLKQSAPSRHTMASVLSVRLKTSHYTPGGYITTSYTAAEVDAIAAYSPELHRCFLVPIGEASGRRAIHLRLDPTRNNQAQGIKWARDYELESVIDRMRS